MIRYSLFLLAFTSFIAGAVASAIPQGAVHSAGNVTVVYKSLGRG